MFQRQAVSLRRVRAVFSVRKLLKRHYDEHTPQSRCHNRGKQLKGNEYHRRKLRPLKAAIRDGSVEPFFDCRNQTAWPANPRPQGCRTPTCKSL